MLPTGLPYTASIHHDGSTRYVQAPDGRELRLGDEVAIRLRASYSAPIEQVLLRSAPDGEQQFVEMLPEDSDPACRWWRCKVKVSMPVYHYRFLLFTADGIWWYNGRGLQRGTPTDGADFRLLADYQPPVWVRESVFYQIFPDRFHDGDHGSNVQDGEYVYRGETARSRRWGEPPSTGSPSMVEFYGGDLKGIEDRLDYLEELGVNALYLNPIFTAYSNHRYDVVDYQNVDPHLGGNQALVSLGQAARRRGIRIVLDIVPNHCGVLHPWFQAAIADSASIEASYFTFRRHPDEYESWLGVRSLPKFNYRSQALRHAMYAGQQAVLRTWLRPPYSIDGWRLDVANMLGQQGADQLGMEVGRGIRQAIREENPEAYILGEHFFDASGQLQGDMWDAVMNYSGFAKPLKYWLAGFLVRQHGRPALAASTVPWQTQAMVDTWEEFRAVIPWEIARQQYNLLGSHDTERIFSLVGGNAALNRLAMGILMTYPGTPAVYYGDEAGLGTGELSHPRACMPWDRSGWDEELLTFYKVLIHLRRSSPALISGGFQVLLVEENTVAYLRDAEEEQLVVVGHRGHRDRDDRSLPVSHGGIPDGAVFQEITSGGRARIENGRLPLEALPPGIQIWRSNRP